MQLDNTYLCLGDDFFQRINPTPVTNPKLFLWNSALAAELGLTETDEEQLARLFCGNQLFENSTPLALAYAGHQFGYFNPQLGDGRAHLLGELKGFDIQLKGSGPTRYSRNGDGRCALGPALREFIMSEALHALGVPTTRTLAVVSSGETVFREQEQPGAIVTRVAASHIRVGSFEYFYAQNKIEKVKQLCEFAITRHFPQLLEFEGPERYLAFLNAVFNSQVNLVVEWMRVGFIHGVMNTDNTAISGETIDYGPCAMINSYNPRSVFSSIDQQGRYAFANQPGIAQWNMARLAECVLPLLDSDEKSAQQKAMPLLTEFAQNYQLRFTQMLANKAGLEEQQQGDESLLELLLDTMRKEKLDYTQTFSQITQSLVDNTPVPEPLKPWYQQWRKRLEYTATPLEEVADSMRRQNPLLIPRNHHVEAVLEQCIDSGTATTAEPFLEALRQPYTLNEYSAPYLDPPIDDDRGYQTFCGT